MSRVRTIIDIICICAIITTSTVVGFNKQDSAVTPQVPITESAEVVSQEPDTCVNIPTISTNIVNNTTGINMVVNSNSEEASKEDIVEEEVVQYITMPAIYGMSLNEAKEVIVSTGLVVGNITEEEKEGATVGTVIWQSIANNALVEVGTSIDIEIAKEPREM